MIILAGASGGIGSLILEDLSKIDHVIAIETADCLKQKNYQM